MLCRFEEPESKRCVLRRLWWYFHCGKGIWTMSVQHFTDDIFHVCRASHVWRVFTVALWPVAVYFLRRKLYRVNVEIMSFVSLRRSGKRCGIFAGVSYDIYVFWWLMLLFVVRCDVVGNFPIERWVSFYFSNIPIRIWRSSIVFEPYTWNLEFNLILCPVSLFIDGKCTRSYRIPTVRSLSPIDRYIWWTRFRGFHSDNN